MKKIFTKQWFIAAFIRSIKTAAQVFLAQVGTEMIGITAISWPAVASVTAMAFILSWVTSLAGLPEVSEAEEESVSNE